MPEYNLRPRGPERQTPIHSGTSYVYFSIVPSPKLASPKKHSDLIIKNEEKNIYFPTDGFQPTTPDAIKYALANVDNTENSTITNWYMQMFGIIPINQNTMDKATANKTNHSRAVHVTAGWNVDKNIQEIIQFHPSVNDDLVDDKGAIGGKISRKELFKREFRKIATTPVGRVLLYRILIEVRRHAKGSNEGILEYPNNETRSTMESRNACRSIIVKFSDKFSFNKVKKAITISNDNHSQATIGNRHVKYTDIVLYKKPLNVSLFHELIHWFHYLRDPNRVLQDKNLNDKHFEDNVLSRYYFNASAANDTGKTVSESIWHAKGKLSFEEMRTILGASPNLGQENYKQGDDLSENLYRKNIGIPLRYGYTKHTFYEDNEVIDKVFDSCNFYKCYYCAQEENVGYDHSSGTKGLENFSIKQ